MDDQKFDWQDQIAKNQELYKLQLMREQNELLSQIANKDASPGSSSSPRSGGGSNWAAVFFVLVLVFICVGSYFIVSLQNQSANQTYVEESTPEPEQTINPGTGYTVQLEWLKALKGCGYKTTKLKKVGDVFYNYKPSAKPQFGQFDVEYSKGLASLNFPKASTRAINCVSQKLYGINASEIPKYDVISLDGGFGIWHGLSHGPPTYTFTFQK